MQQSTKIDQEAYSRILLVLQLEPDLVSNTYAKQILGSMRANKNFSQRNKVRKKYAVLQNEPQQKKKEKKTKRQNKNANQKKWSRFVFGEKNFGTTLLKRPCILWKLKTISETQQIVISKGQVKFRYQAVLKKYRSIRMQFSTLKVIVKDINEIWSLVLAYVDNLAKYNRDVKYLLVAVDCLSGYLRVKPMKTKYASELADAFKK